MDTPHLWVVTPVVLLKVCSVHIRHQYMMNSGIEKCSCIAFVCSYTIRFISTLGRSPAAHLSILSSLTQMVSEEGQI